MEPPEDDQRAAALAWLTGIPTRTFPPIGESAIDGVRHTVYIAGKGPGVLVMHELPGMTWQFARLLRLIAGQGFSVYAPLFFGKAGDSSTLGGVWSTICVRREFNVLSGNGNSRITPWLRALCRTIYSECGGKGVGVIGLCLTGSIVLSVMIEKVVLAPVMGEPAVPLIALTDSMKRAVGVPDADVAAAQKRVRDEGIKLLGIRFCGDRLSPKERFQSLDRVFAGGAQLTQIPTGPPPLCRRGAHATLTEDFCPDLTHPTRQALDAVLVHFKTVL